MKDYQVEPEEERLLTLSGEVDRGLGQQRHPGRDQRPDHRLPTAELLDSDPSDGVTLKIRLFYKSKN